MPPPNPPSRVDAEVVKYCRGWDAGGKLALALPSEVSDRFQHIAVPKNETSDRVVSDRRRRNAREFHLRGSSQHMPTGSLLLEFELGPGEELRICSDDLADMFPSFDVPFSRALTNAVAVKCCLGDFEGTTAAAAFVQRMRGLGREPPLPNTRVVAA